VWKWYFEVVGKEEAHVVDVSLLYFGDHVLSIS
jgi:hypothetical protein